MAIAVSSRRFVLLMGWGAVRDGLGGVDLGIGIAGFEAVVLGAVLLVGLFEFFGTCRRSARVATWSNGETHCLCWRIAWRW